MDVVNTICAVINAVAALLLLKIALADRSPRSGKHRRK